jgi:hypothetical protein
VSRNSFAKFRVEFGEFARLVDDRPLQLLVRELVELTGAPISTFFT